MKELAADDLYRGEVKPAYDWILCQLVHFVRVRADVGSAGYDYLGPFDSPTDMPAENALQVDIHSQLSATGQVRLEVPGVASGRTDLYLPQLLLGGTARIVIETKRFKNKEWRASKVGTWLGQTAAYAQTDIRLGFLGVLDLSVRAPGSPSLSDCFSVRERRFSPTDVRKVTVFRVPGNQQPPSRGNTRKRKAPKQTSEKRSDS